jgi:hypothetical protein
MKRDNSNAVAIGILVFLVGAALLSNPRCERGCRTVGEHLLTHGLDALLALAV